MAGAKPNASEAVRRLESAPSATCKVCLLRPRLGSRDELLWRLDAFNKFLLSASPIARVTAGVSREVCRTLGLSRMVFVRVDWASGRARCATGYGLDVSLLRRVDEPFEASSWVESAVRDGRPAFTSSAEEEHALPLRYVRRFGIGPLLCVPVSDSRGPIGAMLLDRHGAPFHVADEVREAAGAAGLSLGLALEAAGVSASHPDADRAGAPSLTPRESQMLLLLNRGLSNKEIAAATGLSIFTVRDYISGLLRCLDVTSRAAAVARAWELGLVGEEAGAGRVPGEAPATVSSLGGAQAAG